MRTSLLLVIAVVLCGCGESAGGPFCVSDDPVISNLSITPDSAVVGEGGGIIDTYVTFDFRAKDGEKIDFVGYQLVDADGTRLISESIDVKLGRSGSFGFTLFVPTESARTLTVRVQIFDTCLGKSKWAELIFPVQAVAAADGRIDYAVVRLGGYTYLVGGRNRSGDASDAVLQYDSATGLAGTKASLPEGRYLSAAAGYGNNIFVFGGTAHGYAQDSVLVYDPVTDSWTARSPMPVPLGSGYAYMSNGSIFIAGDGETFRYNPEIDSWQ